ncbi:MAG: ABC transporter permease [Phycisphaeraceae bacterium]|nr:ABC transporter permease [Phycisphaeraceae bacterium]
MRQTAAIFLDAYRELNARKLFWIVLAISAAVVLALGLLGNNETGVTVVGFTIPVPFLSTKAISSAGFYKLIFSNVGVQFWLSWGATILALISTAGMIPEFVSSGSIELSLCKPISRARLFLTKYAAGLLFVAIQVLIFSIGGFLVIGIRGGQWISTIFLAVPLVLAFYSFLYCVCALVGLVTRSAITALLLTMVFWLGLWAFNTTDQVLIQLKVTTERDVRRAERNVAALQRTIDSLTQGDLGGPDRGLEAREPDPPVAAAPAPEPDARRPRPPAPPQRPTAGSQRPGQVDFGRMLGAFIRGDSRRAAPTGATADERLRDARRRLETAEDRLTKEQGSLASLNRWYTIVYRVRTFLPKTSETTELLKRYIIDPKDREGIFQVLDDHRGEGGSEREVMNLMYSRSAWWIVGTSLAFEAVVLALATFIFCRRDY